eukprot:CAMPEP_0194411556 /NCGR_PEP_ID=MMETSP0176-20130528/9772_1 /TAXON_ID=216777 /ORGANISM="Proboscia alata, Strain PI-D3" /LENGTH=796 /DNA_ID=CAMNT_0039213629 /DNA_START=421 /DNA_END=2811 /DNA_ORIENTATION=+
MTSSSTESLLENSAAAVVSYKERQKQNTTTTTIVNENEMMDNIEKPQPLPSSIVLHFSHLHLYVKTVENVQVYKELEDNLNSLSSRLVHDTHNNSLDINASRQVWKSIIGSDNESQTEKERDALSKPFVTTNRDVVKQMIAGLGFRVTGSRMPDTHMGANTRSVLVTSSDPGGVQFVVTALQNDKNNDAEKSAEPNSSYTDQYAHFDGSNMKRYFNNHSERQGIAVLAFEVVEEGGSGGSIDDIYQNYKKSHPALLDGNTIQTYSTSDDGSVTKVLEVFSYYQPNQNSNAADRGTVLRFIQHTHTTSSSPPMNASPQLPGMTFHPATFDSNSPQPAYCDHWVSNVVSRTQFLDTLEDTLGFAPKVDFNAGVVAAGESQIESTVTGNSSGLRTSDMNVALRDQSQVYLPINNALSEVGHVHGFIKEIGQGVQHTASRVNDLTRLVQRCNDYRQITGEGFTFLNIPRSYYGVLTPSQLTTCSGCNDEIVISETVAQAIMDACITSGIATSEGAVSLQLQPKDVEIALDPILLSLVPETNSVVEAYRSNKESIIHTILHSRYINLHNLLGNTLSPEQFVAVVQNRILVDVQGQDLLFQIFTGNILQEQTEHESPFLEFIQRVCACSISSSDDGVKVSDDINALSLVEGEGVEEEVNSCITEDYSMMKPGCGGFGIRNFLTLFLSIELSKSMADASRAKANNDHRGHALAQKAVQIFTEQLNESNPILTDIANAMYAEGLAQKELDDYYKEDERHEIILMQLGNAVSDAAKAKQGGNERLMECSTKYKILMRELRQRNAA